MAAIYRKDMNGHDKWQHRQVYTLPNNRNICGKNRDALQIVPQFYKEGYQNATISLFSVCEMCFYASRKHRRQRNVTISDRKRFLKKSHQTSPHRISFDEKMCNQPT